MTLNLMKRSASCAYQSPSAACYLCWALQTIQLPFSFGAPFSARFTSTIIYHAPLSYHSQSEAFILDTRSIHSKLEAKVPERAYALLFGRNGLCLNWGLIQDYHPIVGGP